ncbi:MAG: hypothetical protein ACREX4_22775 [Gammaproteobacteria bacterium]
MTLSESTLLAIQKAGQALFAARGAVAQDVQTNGARVIALVASHPFSPENDQAYKQLRAASRISHELQAMEEQLKALFTSAVEMVAEEAPVLLALPSHGGRSKAHPAKTNAEAEDMVVKSATADAAKPAKSRKRRAGKARRLSPNDEKVLGYLNGVLDRRSWKSVTHATIAEAADIPRGSIGATLSRLIEKGDLREGSKGSYRLASTSAGKT